MRIRNIALTLSLCCALVLVAGCSDVQNRTKENSDPAKASVSLSVSSRSTTTNGMTTETLDAEIEKKITKSLTQLLINGSSKKQLFSEASLAGASVFANYTEASTNEANVAYNYLVGDTAENSLIAAEVTQNVTLDDKKSTHKGTIYFDPAGIVIGYEFE